MTLSGSLDARVEADRISFSFAVTNDGDDPVTLTFHDAQHADFIVVEGESERWRWSEDRLFAQLLGSEELGAGDSVTYEGEWENPVSGDHTAVATLEAENRDCEARTDVST